MWFSQNFETLKLLFSPAIITANFFSLLTNFNLGNITMQALDYGFNHNHRTRALEGDQGQNLPHNYPRHIRQAQPRLSRQEQRIAYDFYTMKITESPPKMEANSKVKMCSVPVNTSEKVAFNDLTKTHLQNIYRSLEHRLKVAQSQGDKFLINLLENESQASDFLCLDCF